MKFAKRLFAIFSTMAMLLVGTTASADNITIKGSDTMVILAQRWAEEFMKQHPQMQVQVTGGGSGTGISALINGTTDICQSSRPMKQSEKDKLRERYNSPPTEISVARDGVSVYLNESNPIHELTLGQLKDIFTGKITNWKDVGGPDAKIIVYSRENSSGTYVFFKEEVLKGADYMQRAQTLQGTAAVVNAVAREKFGIGYGGAAYAKGIKIVSLKRDAASPSIAPNKDTVQNNSYPLARSLFFYLRGPATGDIKTFITYVLSNTGQEIATQVGYYPNK
jgi:phosphate transport system substrate-binding protein